MNISVTFLVEARNNPTSWNSTNRDSHSSEENTGKKLNTHTHTTLLSVPKMSTCNMKFCVKTTKDQDTN